MTLVRDTRDNRYRYPFPLKSVIVLTTTVYLATNFMVKDYILFIKYADDKSSRYKTYPTPVTSMSQV